MIEQKITWLKTQKFTNDVTFVRKDSNKRYLPNIYISEKENQNNIVMYCSNV